MIDNFKNKQVKMSIMGTLKPSVVVDGKSKEKIN